MVLLTYIIIFDRINDFLFYYPVLITNVTQHQMAEISNTIHSTNVDLITNTAFVSMTNKNDENNLKSYDYSNPPRTLS